MTIAIISSAVRIGRKSHWVALYFKNYIEQQGLATVDLIDLAEYQFPLFEERLRFMPSPPPNVLEFAQRITQADGVLIVTPEYNGGYPASLKNVVDLLYAEWKRKPIALATVSGGPFGGAQVMTSLVFSLWKIGAWVVPAQFQVAKVQESYDETGTPKDKEGTDKRAKAFLEELRWCVEANKRMQEKDVKGS
jgi:NAD(P)H-dependent FMN reductase